MLYSTEISSETELFLIYEYVEYDLKKYLEIKGKLNTFELKLIVRQILEAINFAHQHQVLHRDLKPQNILIKSNGTVKLADFGLSRPVTEPAGPLTAEVPYHYQIVTLWYRCPEVLLGMSHYTSAVDMWSLGAILCSPCVYLVELVTAKPLFKSDTEIGQLFKIFSLLGTPTMENCPGLTCLPHFKKK